MIVIMKLGTVPVAQKKRVMTSFEIGDLKGPWDAYCAANGVSSVEALCQVIQKLTGADAALLPAAAVSNSRKVSRPATVFKTREGVEKKSRRHRLYLSLTESERLAVETRAKADGFEQGTTWAVGLIRARLTDEAQFGTHEIEALSESNHQLLAIGRNLNQIAYALNAAHGRSTIEYDAELVGNLADAVKRHVKKVGDALRASINRWTLE